MENRFKLNLFKSLILVAVTQLNLPAKAQQSLTCETHKDASITISTQTKLLGRGTGTTKDEATNKAKIQCADNLLESAVRIDGKIKDKKGSYTFSCLNSESCDCNPYWWPKDFDGFVSGLVFVCNDSQKNSNFISECSCSVVSTSKVAVEYGCTKARSCANTIAE